MTDINWNDEVQRQVLDLLQHGQLVLLTGGAGSGKSYLLNELVNAIPNSIVLTPTGVAAQLLNDKYAVKAQTIHSFFKFPLHREKAESINLLSHTKRSIRNANAILLDEVSMVDSARLDSIDGILRDIRENDMPFGGVAICLVGDLAQLPPVVPNKCSSGISEAEVLKKMGYASQRVDGAKIWPLFADNSFELQGSRRINGTSMDDKRFYGVLNNMRQRLLGAQINPKEEREGLYWLNQRCVQHDLTTDFITIASTNAMVQQINTAKLAVLKGNPRIYQGIIKGEWRNDIARAPLELTLKVGAKVICVMNDPMKQFVNGTQGRVVALEDDGIIIAIKVTKTGISTEKEVEISPARWDNWQYQWDDEKDELVVKSVGHFIQLPIALGFALTVNSAQGLTIDNGVRFLNDRIFNPHLPYVGISRVRSVNSLELSQPLTLY